MSDSIWNDNSVVTYYAEKLQLQEPEATIKDILEKELPSMRMLDLGVGTGRTTIHFAKRVKHYVGVDISSAMLNRCIEQFGDSDPDVVFKLMNATDMHEFGNNEFDFVFFSYNGIDYVSDPDRIKALGEIRRVLRPGGVFAFSSHNLYFVPHLYSYRFSLNFASFKKLVKWFFLVFINGWHGRYKRKNHAIIKDGAYGFRLSTYYIKPEYQVEQLKQQQFKNIRMFSQDGNEMSTDITNGKDPWIYYLCTNEKSV